MNRWPLVLAIGVLTPLSVAQAEVTESENAKLLEQVKAAAQARSAGWNSCRIEWTETVTYAPGGVMPAGPDTAQHFGDTAGLKGIPPSETKERTPCRLLAHGEWMYYRSRSNAIDRDGALSFGRRDSTYDGTVSRTLTRGSDGELHGRDNDLARLEESTGPDLMPLMAFLRFDNGKLTGRSFRKFRVVNADTEISGRNCVEVEGPSERLYFDKHRDFVLVQRNNLPGRGYHCEVIVEYVLGGEVGWRPTKWVARHYRGESDIPMMVCDVRVTRFELQVEFEKKDFTITFPPGTRVYDPVTQKSRIVPADSAE